MFSFGMRICENQPTALATAETIAIILHFLLTCLVTSSYTERACKNLHNVVWATLRIHIIYSMEY